MKELNTENLRSVLEKETDAYRKGLAAGEYAILIWRINELEKQVKNNVALTDVKPSLPDKETVSEPIQNALFATGMMCPEVCDDVTRGILSYLDDAGFAIKRKE